MIRISPAQNLIHLLIRLYILISQISHLISNKNEPVTNSKDRNNVKENNLNLDKLSFGIDIT